MESAAEWTFLLYCGTIDNTFSFSTKELEKLLADAVISSRVNFVYEISRPDSTERGRVRSGDDNDGAPVAEPLAKGPPLDTAAADAITAFIDWATRVFPSRYTALIFKDHASASILPPPCSARHSRSWLAPTAAAQAHRLRRGSDLGVILADGKTNRSVSDRELRTIVENTRLGHVDVYAFDACSMSTVEVAYEIRNVASFMVASELYIGDSAFPYACALSACSTESHVGPRRVARKLAPKPKHVRDARLIAVELAWMDKLAEQLDDVAGHLSALLAKHFATMAAMREGLSKFPYVVEFDLAQVLAHCRSELVTSSVGQIRDEIMREAFAKAIKQAESTLERSWSGTAPLLDTACGLGIFFPAVNGVPDMISYGGLAFPQRTRWGRFLAEFCYQDAIAAAGATNRSEGNAPSGKSEEK